MTLSTIRAQTLPMQARKKLLIVHFWGLGDWLMFSPSLRAIVNSGKYDIQLLIRDRSLQNILKHYDCFASVNTLQKDLSWQTFQTFRTLRTKFDDILFTSGLDIRKTDLMALGLRSQRILALSRSPGYKTRFVTQTVDYSPQSHLAENNLRLTAALGVETENVSTYLPIKDLPEETPQSVLIHPGCDREQAFRRWSLEKFLQVARQLLEQGRPVGVLIGPSETELLPMVQEMAPEKLVVHSGLTFDEAIKVVSSYQTVLNSDSGIGHIAAALDKRVVSIFGPSNDVAHRPFSKRATVIKTSRVLDCMPCAVPNGRYGCPERPCLEDITVERVLDALRA